MENGLFVDDLQINHNQYIHNYIYGDFNVCIYVYIYDIIVTLNHEKMLFSHVFMVLPGILQFPTASEHALVYSTQVHT